MHCLRGGEERAKALNPTIEWETPDVEADEKFPKKKTELQALQPGRRAPNRLH